MNYQLLIFSIASVVSFLGLLDVFIFLFKTGVKQSLFSKSFHKISYVCLVVVVYYILNGYKFI